MPKQLWAGVAGKKPPKNSGAKVESTNHGENFKRVLSITDQFCGKGQEDDHRKSIKNR